MTCDQPKPPTSPLTFPQRRCDATESTVVTRNMLGYFASAMTVTIALHLQQPGSGRPNSNRKSAKSAQRVVAITLTVFDSPRLLVIFGSAGGDAHRLSSWPWRATQLSPIFTRGPLIKAPALPGDTYCKASPLPLTHDTPTLKLRCFGYLQTLCRVPIFWRRLRVKGARMDAVTLGKLGTKSRFRAILEESWLHAVLMVNDFIAHTTAAAVMLVAVKLLALLFTVLWPNSGFKAFEGTPYEFSVETIFATAEIGIFVVYSIYAVTRGVKRCFGK
jgi:hypothetical protein